MWKSPIFWGKRKKSSNFPSTIFCYKTSDHLPSLVAQTKLEYDNLLTFYEFLKYEWTDLNLDSLNYFFFLLPQKFLLFDKSECKPYSNMTISSIFMIFLKFELPFGTLWTLFHIILWQDLWCKLRSDTTID